MRSEQPVEREGEHGERSETSSGPLSEISKMKPEEVLATVSSLAREHPHAALAGACAIGFILGGGLSPRLVGAIGMLAVRRYLAESMRETLESVVREARAGAGP